MGEVQEMKKMIAYALVLWLALSSLNLAHADCCAGEAGEGAAWHPISAGPLTTWSSFLCEKGSFVVQPFFFYNRTRGTFGSDGRYDALASDDNKYQYQQQIFIQYGLTEGFEMDAQVVYQENHVRRGAQEAASLGWGDSYLFLRTCLLKDEDSMPQVLALFQMKFPTGKYQKADAVRLGTDLMGASTGGGSYDPGLGLVLTKKLNPWLFHADAIISFPREARVDGVNTRYGRYANYDFGFEYFLEHGLSIMLEWNGFLQEDKSQNGNHIAASDASYLVVAPGIGWSNNKIQALLAYQRTLVGTNTDANDNVVFTCVYSF